MRSNNLSRHFQTLAQQRASFLSEIKLLSQEQLWYRADDKKWSIGEHLYHLYLMVRMLQIVTKCSFVLLPYAKMKRKSPFATEIHDIYAEFHQKKGRGMNAPFVLVPPEKVRYSMDITDLENLLEERTNELKALVGNIEEDIAGHIIFFDPIAQYPNLIQAIQLLAIHEQHHFNVIKKTYLIEGAHVLI
jgi:DinB superfamily